MMKKFIIKVGLLIALFNYARAACAQQYQSALEDIQKIQKSYTDNGYVSFKILFSYAKISAPATMVDSLSANYKYKSGKFYCKLGAIEFVQNDSMNVALYNKDKIMMIGKAYKTMERGNMLIDGWDSTFVAENIDTITVTSVGANKKMQIFFKPNSAYSNCTLEYNKQNYRPQKISYIKKSSMYYPDSTGKADGIIATMQFSGYSNAAFNESVFDTRKFTIKQNGKWMPQALYSTYRFVNSYFDN